MGSGYNPSEAASASARGKASTRTPIHFWLSVPMYEYDLGCGRNEHLHTFQTRTPFIGMEEDDSTLTVWCSGCQEFRVIDIDQAPLNQPVSNDERIAFEQDKGLLRERIALKVQDQGFLEHDEEIAIMAVEFGVPVAEIKKINAGLRAPEGLSGMPDMCQAGLHEMTIDNIKVKNGRRSCLACHRARDRESAARKRAVGRTPRS